MSQGVALAPLKAEACLTKPQTNQAQTQQAALVQEDVILQGITVTMGTTAKELAKVIKVPKPLTWEERRAKYQPNHDAIGLGYGKKHRDYNRYMSPWSSTTEQSLATELEGENAARNAEEKTKLERMYKANCPLGVPPQPAPGTDPLSLPFGVSAPAVGNYAPPGAMTRAQGITVGSVPKPTRVAHGKVVQDAVGLGNGTLFIYLVVILTTPHLHSLIQLFTFLLTGIYILSNSLVLIFLPYFGVHPPLHSLILI